MFESKTARPNIVHLVSFLVKTDKCPRSVWHVERQRSIQRLFVITDKAPTRGKWDANATIIIDGRM